MIRLAAHPSPQVIVVGTDPLQIQPILAILRSAGYTALYLHSETAFEQCEPAQQAQLALIERGPAGDTAILAIFRRLRQRPNLVIIGEDGLSLASGFGRLDSGPYQAQVLPDLLRTHLGMQPPEAAVAADAPSPLVDAPPGAAVTADAPSPLVDAPPGAGVAADAPSPLVDAPPGAAVTADAPSPLVDAPPGAGVAADAPAPLVDAPPEAAVAADAPAPGAAVAAIEPLVVDELPGAAVAADAPSPGDEPDVTLLSPLEQRLFRSAPDPALAAPASGPPWKMILTGLLILVALGLGGFALIRMVRSDPTNSASLTPGASTVTPVATSPTVAVAPGLEVRLIGIDPDPPLTGEVVNVQVQVRNLSDQVISMPFWVDLYVTPEETPAPGLPWSAIATYGATWRIERLDPGETRALNSLDADPTRSNLLSFDQPGVQQLYVLGDTYHELAAMPEDGQPPPGYLDGPTEVMVGDGP